MIEILDCPFAGEIKGDLIKWFKLDKQKHSSGLVLKSKENGKVVVPLQNTVLRDTVSVIDTNYKILQKKIGKRAGDDVLKQRKEDEKTASQFGGAQQRQKKLGKDQEFHIKNKIQKYLKDIQD